MKKYTIESNSRLTILNLLFLCFISYSTIAQNPHCCKGIVRFRTKPYNTTLQAYVYEPTYYPDNKAWFKDSIVIIQSLGISMNTDSNNVETRKVVVMHYTYINLKNMVFYKYANFADTAKIIQSYTRAQADTVFWGVNWKFYEPKNIPFTEPLQNLCDTSIEGKIFKRVRIIDNPLHDVAKATISIAYFDCANKNTIFQVDMALGKKIGCPMTKLLVLPNKYFSGATGEIEYLSESLSKEELKVFAAWERNEKKYPVK